MARDDMRHLMREHGRYLGLVIGEGEQTFAQLLLGILDRATLRQGDNTIVNFEKSLIFLTSNLGAREMAKEVRPEIGFATPDSRSAGGTTGRLESIGLAAVRKRFSPEFVNRIDVVITYQPLEIGRAHV